MAYINILEKRYDIKVIGIDVHCITEDTRLLLEDNESYRDTEDGIGEHFYSAHDILENVGNTMLETDQLELIRDICHEAGAQFFRITKNSLT